MEVEEARDTLVDVLAGDTEGEVVEGALGDEEVENTGMKVEVVMTRTHPGSRDPREHLPGL